MEPTTAREREGLAGNLASGGEHTRSSDVELGREDDSQRVGGPMLRVAVQASPHSGAGDGLQAA